MLCIHFGYMEGLPDLMHSGLEGRYGATCSSNGSNVCQDVTQHGNTSGYYYFTLLVHFFGFLIACLKETLFRKATDTLGASRSFHRAAAAWP